MSFEDQVRSDLGDIRVPEALSPPADLADTVLIGMRRQARRRASVAAGGLVIAVAVASATAPVWLSPRPDAGPVAPTDRACGGPLPTRPPSQTWEYFDPLTNEIDAGGVTGYQVKDFVGTTYFQGLNMINPAGDRSVWVLLYAAGGEPHYIDDNDKAVPFDPGAGEPAGSVDGAPAYWLPDGHFSGDVNVNERGLAWQWAPGAWAFVVAAEVTRGGGPATPTASAPSNVDAAELRTIAAQVAPHLELGVGTPVTSPFSMPVPDCTRLAMSVVSHVTADDGSPYTVFLLGFDTADKVAPTYPPPGDLQSSLLVIADTGDAPDDRDRLTEYPEDLGYPAYLDASEGILSVYEVFGFAVNVWPFAMPNADTDAEKASLAAGIFRTITIYPGAADSEAAWGDPIVR
jgi:hypothetical protein